MKHSATLVVALAGIVVASPAPMPQMPDLDAIELAPTVALTGPPVAASNQTDVYPSESAVAAAAAEVTAPASTTTPERRGMFFDFFGGWGHKHVATSSTLCTTTATPAPSVEATTSSAFRTPTTTTTSSTACPTTPEEGTYCGFINPEDACAPQPDGYGAKVMPDTVDAFIDYAPFHELAQKTVTPKTYENTFKDLNASVSANSYLGLHTLSSYNAQGCSEWCDNTTLCTGFNIYIERDPSQNPTKGDAGKGEYCPNPSSITNFKCTLWGSGVDAEAATNFGDWREDFQTVIVGSNGYEKTNNTTPATCDGYKPPKPCDGGAINKPTCHIGSKFFPGPFNPKVCASYASAQATKNKNSVNRGQKYLPCNMFNAYMMKKNGKAQGTYCSLYSEFIDKSFASYKGGWSGKNHFGVESSWMYELNEEDKGVKGW